MLAPPVWLIIPEPERPAGGLYLLGTASLRFESAGKSNLGLRLVAAKIMVQDGK
jgi:hypothetical protein